MDTEQAASPRGAARALRQEAEAEVRSLTFWRRPLIRWLSRRLRQGMAQREAAKSALSATAEPTRRVFLEIGRRLALAGCLRVPDDIFHLAAFEIQSYLLGDWEGNGARELADDRRLQRERWLDSNPPDVIMPGGGGAMPREFAAPAPGVQRHGWIGIGVAPGTSQGMCRIVRHPGDGGTLQQGEILVAPSTDPGWTPLFLRAGGIVMETGGYLSHGAIVAREYGIPAVVNIPGFLTEVRNGDTLRLDGDYGTVTLVR